MDVVNFLLTRLLCLIIWNGLPLAFIYIKAPINTLNRVQFGRNTKRKGIIPNLCKFFACGRLIKKKKPENNLFSGEYIVKYEHYDARSFDYIIPKPFNSCVFHERLFDGSIKKGTRSKSAKLVVRNSAENLPH
jgi:hypothetical protein